MIVPLVDDAVWLSRFEDCAPLQPASGRYLVVAPHPDDETLGAGGLIAALVRRGQRVDVAAVTDGENAYEISQAERDELGALRQREQEEALSCLGVERESIRRLRLTDSAIGQQQVELEARLSELVQPGMTLIAPWEGDFHPDHVSCARAAEVVAERFGLARLSYFFWTWHRGEPSLLDGLPVRRFDLRDDLLQQKTLAVSKHRSQLQRTSGDPILPDYLLGPARWPFEVFLPQ